MGMNDQERFALAARLATSLKRSSGRIVDVLWLMQDEAYGREVLRLARLADAECIDLAFRYEQLIREKSRAVAPAAPATPAAAFTATGSHYVRGLR